MGGRFSVEDVYESVNTIPSKAYNKVRLTELPVLILWGKRKTKDIFRCGSYILYCLLWPTIYHLCIRVKKNHTSQDQQFLIVLSLEVKKINTGHHGVYEAHVINVYMTIAKDDKSTLYSPAS